MYNKGKKKQKTDDWYQNKRNTVVEGQTWAHLGSNLGPKGVGRREGELKTSTRQKSQTNIWMSA